MALNRLGDKTLVFLRKRINKKPLICKRFTLAGVQTLVWQESKLWESKFGSILKPVQTSGSQSSKRHEGNALKS